MVTILYQLLRYCIIAAVQLGLASVVINALSWVLEKMMDVVKETFALDDDSAGAVVGNMFIDLVALVGGTAAVISTKIPVATARKLGFAGGLKTKKAISETAQKKIETVVAAGTPASKKSLFDKVISYGGLPGKILFSVFAISQIIEPLYYAPEQVNQVWKMIGLDLNVPGRGIADKPSTFTNKEWKEFISGLQQAGVTALRDDVRGTNLVFNEKNAAALLVRLSGQAALKGENLTVKKAKEAIAPYLVRGALTDETKIQQAVRGSSSAAGVSIASGATVAEVARAAASEVLPFQPRDNDIIESMQELNESAHNNVSAFVQTLNTRLRYEVRIVSSIKSKDGSTTYGTNTTVTIGKFSDGRPKTKIVRSKFAVLDVFSYDETGKRVKLQTITLGPVDTVNFPVTTADVADVGNNLGGQQVINYTVRQENTAQLTIEATPQNPLGDAEQGEDVPSITQKPYIERDYSINGDGFYNAVRFRIGSKVYETYFVEDMLTDEEILKLGNYGKAIEEVQRRLLQMGIDVNKFKRDTFYWEYEGRAAEMIRCPWQQFFFERLPGESAAAPSPIATAAGSSATTLSVWYAAQGQPFPTVTARGAIYESLGLGSKALYTGTAEQNTKLLAALKTQ